MIGEVRQLDNRIMSIDDIIMEDGRKITRYWVDRTINNIITRMGE